MRIESDYYDHDIVALCKWNADRSELPHSHRCAMPAVAFYGTMATSRLLFVANRKSRLTSVPLILITALHTLITIFLILLFRLYRITSIKKKKNKGRGKISLFKVEFLQFNLDWRDFVFFRVKILNLIRLILC